MLTAVTLAGRPGRREAGVVVLVAHCGERGRGGEDGVTWPAVRGHMCQWPTPMLHTNVQGSEMPRAGVLVGCKHTIHRDQ